VAAIVDLHRRGARPAASHGAARPGAGTRAGHSIVLGGPPGCGSTEVAISLAAGLAARPGVAVALVDADGEAPSIAPRLGLAIEPNLRTAIDAVEYSARDARSLGQLAPAGFTVLPGAPLSARFAPRVDEMARMLGLLFAEHEYLVIDTSHAIASPGDQQPNSVRVTRTLLAEADTVIGVGHASPVGVVRLLSWLSEVRTLAPNVPLHVLLNCAPRDGFRRAELVAEIAGVVPLSSVCTAPHDRRVVLAGWSGDVARRGPFARAVGALCREVIRSRGAERRLAS
jgi:MinD-like ATPase involved in chromosome partitioning or flagellar assembly